MKQLSLVTLSLAAALSLTACNNSGEPAAPDVTESTKSLLSHVPADTPYVMANLRPIPEDVLDANFRRMEPVMAEMQQQLSTLKTGLESDDSSVTGEDLTDHLLLALLNELDGKLNRAGLESLGWDLQSTSVIYGAGAFPVARFGLSDAATLRATLLRVMENAGVNATEHELQGISYWRMTAPDTTEVPVGIYVSILPDHLAVSMYPAEFEAEFLPTFLGLETPDSNASELLAGLNTRHGFTPYGTAYLDLHGLADEFMDPGTAMARVMKSSGEFDPASLSEQCITETHGIIDNAPVMTFGFTEMTVDAVGYRFLVETASPLAAQLQELVAEIPAARALSDRIAELAFGMKVGAVRDFLRQKAQAVVDDPFQCEHFAEMNQHAEEALVKLDQPIPPFVNNFRGFRLSLKDLVLDPGTSIPTDVRGHLAVHVDQPEMFVGMAQMFLPDLSELTIAPGEPPVRIPDSMVSIQGIVAYAAMSYEAIGMSLGEGEEVSLPEFLDAGAGPEGTFLSADYDYDAYYEYQLKGLKTGTSDDNPYGSVMAISRASMLAAKEAVDRNHVDMKFTADGLVIESRVTYEK